MNQSDLRCILKSPVVRFYDTEYREGEKRRVKYNEKGFGLNNWEMMSFIELEKMIGGGGWKLRSGI